MIKKRRTNTEYAVTRTSRTRARTYRSALIVKLGMDAFYGVPFRVGETGPGMRLLIGAWAELGEGPVPIALYVCPECGRILTFAGEKTIDRLKRAARHA